MYYLQMQTLVKPQPHTTIAISADRLIQKEIIGNQLINDSGKKKNIMYFLLSFSFLIFIFLPESPKLSESICTKYHSELICNVW